MYLTKGEFLQKFGILPQEFEEADIALFNTCCVRENAEDKLILSTIHSVKGLEFDTIILLDCVDDILPSTTYIGSPEDNEDVRCMYVAVTRAKTVSYTHLTLPTNSLV